MSDPDDKDKPTDRRGFFREGLRSLISPLADIVQKRLEHVRDAMKLPPGVLDDAEGPGDEFGEPTNEPDEPPPESFNEQPPPPSAKQSPPTV